VDELFVEVVAEEASASLKAMRRIAMPTLAVLAVLVIGAAPSGARAGHKMLVKCSPAGSHVVLANAQAQVYIAPDGTTVRGCVRGRRRSYTLGEFYEEACSPSGCGGVTLETLAGTMVAYEELFSGGRQLSYTVFVLDLRTGRLLHQVPTGVLAKPLPLHVGSGPAANIVVKSDGAVAWIAENEELSAKEVTYYELHALDKTGSRVLASGPNIDTSSLKLTGSTLHWKQGGKRASAVLN